MTYTSLTRDLVNVDVHTNCGETLYVYKILSQNQRPDPQDGCHQNGNISSNVHIYDAQYFASLYYQNYCLFVFRFNVPVNNVSVMSGTQPLLLGLNASCSSIQLMATGVQIQDLLFQSMILYY